MMKLTFTSSFPSRFVLNWQFFDWVRDIQNDTFCYLKSISFLWIFWRSFRIWMDWVSMNATYLLWSQNYLKKSFRK
jgi:hypothetical protein